MFISNAESEGAVMAQAIAGGAILALVTHTMIPEALHKGGSTVVLPVILFSFAAQRHLVTGLSSGAVKG